MFTQHYYTSEGQEVEKEILVSQYTDGKQSWQHIIPRPSSSVGSFSYLFSSNGFYAFYDDRPDCLKSNSIDKYDPDCYKYIASFRPTSGTAVYTYISPDGKMARKERNASEDWAMYKTLSYEDDAKRNVAYMKMVKVKNATKVNGSPGGLIGSTRYDMIKVK